MKAHKQLIAVLLMATSAFSGLTSKAATIDTFGTGINQLSVEFVPIGNPGNTPDTMHLAISIYVSNTRDVGSVPYHYKMSKYEVSRDLVDKANALGGLGIVMSDMTPYGGNHLNRPATGVSWNEAARFVNWLNTSRGYAPAYKFDVQPGEVGYSANANIQFWTAGDPGFSPANPIRNSQSRYFLPTLDEWYKAAYFDPHANGGSGGYWTFPTGSDSEPIPVAGGTGPDSAVFGQPSAQGPADVNNAGGLSAYGVMGMGGNVWEWEENSADLFNASVMSHRGVQGGSWGSPSNYFSSNGPFRSSLPFLINTGALLPGELLPTYSSFSIGFRVASIPEPSSLGLVALTVLAFHRRVRYTAGRSQTIARD